MKRQCREQELFWWKERGGSESVAVETETVESWYRLERCQEHVKTQSREGTPAFQGTVDCVIIMGSFMHPPGADLHQWSLVGQIWSAPNLFQALHNVSLSVKSLQEDFGSYCCPMNMQDSQSTPGATATKLQNSTCWVNENHTLSYPTISHRGIRQVTFKHLNIRGLKGKWVTERYLQSREGVWAGEGTVDPISVGCN